MKKTVSFVLAFILLVLVFTACEKGPRPIVTEKEPAEIEPPESVVIIEGTEASGTEPFPETEKAETEGSKETEKAETEKPKETEKAETEKPKETEKAETEKPKETEKAETEKPKETEKAETEKPKETEKAETEKPKETEKAETEAPKETEKAEPELKPTTGNKLSNEDIYKNAYENTLTLTNYSTQFSASFAKKALLGGIGIDLSGTLKTKDQTTNGSGKATILGIKCNFEYTASTNKNGRTTSYFKAKRFDFQCPFDFASLGSGVVSPIPKTAYSKIKAVDKEKTEFTVSMTNAEVWKMYGNVLDYLVKCAVNSKIDMENLRFSKATLVFTVKNGMIKTMRMDLEGKADLGKVEMSFYANVSPSK